MSDVIRVRVFEGRNEVDAAQEGLVEPTHVVECEAETPTVWQEDPHYHSPPIGLDIHPDDRPAKLNVYTSESVRSPPGYDNHVETGYWDGPIERGLPFTSPEGEVPSFGCEVWGRVMFFVEPMDE